MAGELLFAQKHLVWDPPRIESLIVLYLTRSLVGGDRFSELDLASLMRAIADTRWRNRQNWDIYGYRT